MTQADWARGDAFALGAFLNGAEIPTLAPDGEPVADESFIVLFNAWREPVTFVLPPTRFGRRWAHELSTAEPELPPNGTTLPARAVGAGARPRADRAAPGRLSQPARGVAGAGRRRHTSTTRGSNCVPAASARRRSASSVGSASR